MSADEGPGRVLVVDDEPSIVDAVSTVLRYEGFSITEAGSGRKALQLIQDEKFDLVILDVMLPDLDGYEVCRALKSSGSTSRVPIVIVTARVAAENRIESFRAGADDCQTPHDLRRPREDAPLRRHRRLARWAHSGRRR